MQCEKKEKPQGLEVEARSGIGAQTICDLHKDTNIKHIVTIRNKRTYRVDIECKGSINSNPRKAEFSSPNAPPDTSTNWSAQVSLFDGEEHTFEHVSLVCNSYGIENIHTEVSAYWSQSLKMTTISLGFQVNTSC